LDTDRHASAFDAIAAYDAGVGCVLQYGGVRPQDVRGLLYGLLFARGSQDLGNSAVFIGGSDLSLAETLLEVVQGAFVGPQRVSVMIDASGSNTTAAAAVAKVLSVGALVGKKVIVLAGTGPVGRRTAALLAREGAQVTLTSRRLASARAVCRSIRERCGVSIRHAQVLDEAGLRRVVDGAYAVLTTGPPGVTLLPEVMWRGQPTVRVLADVNAVPPPGVEGIEMTWNGARRDDKVLFGAYGIGGLKKRVHRACLTHLYDRSDLVLDAEEICAMAIQMEKACTS
jgi:hypothetical protein